MQVFPNCFEFKMNLRRMIWVLSSPLKTVQGSLSGYLGPSVMKVLEETAASSSKHWAPSQVSDQQRWLRTVCIPLKSMPPAHHSPSPPTSKQEVTLPSYSARLVARVPGCWAKAGRAVLWSCHRSVLRHHLHQNHRKLFKMHKSGPHPDTLHQHTGVGPKNVHFNQFLGYSGADKFENPCNARFSNLPLISPPLLAKHLQATTVFPTLQQNWV